MPIPDRLGSVTITGDDLRITTAGTTHDTPEPAPTLVPAVPVVSNLGAVIEACQRPNPYWSEAANLAAETRPPGVRPVDIARQYKNHRIEPK